MSICPVFKNATFWVIFKHCAVSMFFFRLSRASAGWTQEQKNVKRKGYLFPREEMFIDSSPNAIFCLLRFFPRLRWPQHNGNLQEQNSIWLQLHYLVTNSFVFWWKLQIRRKSWEIFPKIWNVGTQQKWCTFKHMQFQVHYAVANTYHSI